MTGKPYRNYNFSNASAYQHKPPASDAAALLRAPSTNFSRQEPYFPPGQSMAQRFMQQYTKPKGDAHTQAWSFQRGYSHDSKLQLTPSTLFESPSVGETQNAWSGVPVDENLVLNNQFSMEPFFMGSSNTQFTMNHHLYFNGSMGLPYTGRDGMNDVGQYMPSSLNGLPRGSSSFQGSDLETNTTSSPRSYFSVPSDLDHTLNTDPIMAQPAPTGVWAGFDGVCEQSFRRSSPYESGASRAEMPTPHGHSHQRCSGTDTAESSQSVAQFSSLNESFQNQGNRSGRLMQLPVAKHHHFNWENSVLQGVDTKGLSWPLSKQPIDAIVPSSSKRNQTTNRDEPYSAPSMSKTDPDTPFESVGQVQGQWRHSCSTEGKQDIFVGVSQTEQGRAQAQRKLEDRILLDGKAAGLTYKAIRKKMATDIAESTLRGRYRSLTKARKDRVRKPIWKDRDIKLLEQIVTSELSRLDEGYRNLTPAQKLAKLSWKRVAEHISENGGSYHFGNSTCKKKWAQIKEIKLAD